MSTNMDDLFGDICDFNGDGETDFGEEWTGCMIIEGPEEENQTLPAFTSKPYKPESPPRVYTDPVDIPLPQVTKKEELKSLCSMRRITIMSSIAAALIMLAPIVVLVWAAYDSYDPRNSASGLIIAIFSIAGLAIGGVIVNTAGKEICKAKKEIAELKQSYKRNRQEEK